MLVVVIINQNVLPSHTFSLPSKFFMYIIFVIPLCYYNDHIKNPLTSVLFLIKTWHKRYLFVNDELINTYRLLSLDYHFKYDERDPKRKPVNF
jgi:hypothetical protein